MEILNKGVAIPWELKDIIDKCLSLMSFFTHCRVQHVYREGNISADYATNEALKCNGWTHWVNNQLSMSLKDKLLKEKIEYVYNLQR